MCELSNKKIASTKIGTWYGACFVQFPFLQNMSCEFFFPWKLLSMRIGLNYLKTFKPCYEGFQLVEIKCSLKRSRDFRTWLIFVFQFHITVCWETAPGRKILTATNLRHKNGFTRGFLILTLSHLFLIIRRRERKLFPSISFLSPKTPYPKGL